MKALVLKSNAHLEYREVSTPEPLTEKSYLIRVKACGICGSDLHRAFENGAYHYPLIMGHEFSGIVEEGFEGAIYRKGTPVTAFPLIPCRKCKPCQVGDFAQCQNYNYLGSRTDGAFAEFVYVPEENLFPLPPGVDFIEAAMTEPAAVALHGVRKLSILGGETAAVFGGGPIGNMVAQFLRYRGCERIFVVDIDNKKLSIAESMGFIPVDSSKENPVEKIMKLTDGEGAQKVIEACGLPVTYLQSIKSVSRKGEVVLLGNISGELKLGRDDVSSLLRKEIKLYGTWNSKIVPKGEDDWSTVLRLINNKELKLKPLVSHTPPLEEGAKIFSKLYQKKEFFNKVIFRMD